MNPFKYIHDKLKLKKMKNKEKICDDKLRNEK